jgi:hypothetical protein
MLHVLEPSERPALGLRPPQPVTPLRMRSTSLNPLQVPPQTLLRRLCTRDSRVPPWPQPHTLCAVGEHDNREVEQARSVQREAKQAQQDWMSRVGETSAGLYTPRWPLQLGPSDVSTAYRGTTDRSASAAKMRLTMYRLTIVSP